MLNKPLLKVQGYKFNKNQEQKIEKSGGSNDIYKSLMQLSMLNKKSLQSMVYELTVDTNYGPQKKFVQIKYQEFKFDGDLKRMIQIIDLSAEILYD